MDPSANVALVGMPGVGKSTVGVLLAKRLRLQFVDTDLLIQAGEGKSLRELIDVHGPAGFSAIEGRYVAALEVKGHVIATGGSVVYQQDAMAGLRARATVIYLQTSAAELVRRVGDLSARGIVMKPGQTLQDLCEERHPLYQRHAHLVVDVQGLAPEGAVTRITEALHP
ncbi:MAG: shikimate kinase [Opitutales bacterium]